MYREVLRSVELHKDKFRTDELQLLHTLHNLAEVLALKPEGVYPTLRDDQLTKQVQNSCNLYHYQIEIVYQICPQFSS